MPISSLKQSVANAFLCNIKVSSQKHSEQVPNDDIHYPHGGFGIYKLL